MRKNRGAFIVKTVKLIIKSALVNTLSIKSKDFYAKIVLRRIRMKKLNVDLKDAIINSHSIQSITKTDNSRRRTRISHVTYAKVN